ncbi:MAG: hypothetical protein N3B21_12025 [Clostridia bacterium]|nr:hypothetical protein [Clostridia bacterium]
MSKHDDNRVKIEAGQILNPECFPLPNELVCIQVPKVFDQVSLRDCVTETIPLITVPNTSPLPTITFEGATNFDIVRVNLLSKVDSPTRRGFKKIRVAVTLQYDVTFRVSGQPHSTTIKRQTTFVLTVNEIYCPDCTTQTGLQFQEIPSVTLDTDSNIIKVEAIAEAFNDRIIATNVGSNVAFTLNLDIGAFFVVKCECVVQLLIPSYGYCPVPPEQQNPAAQTCGTFLDRTRTPFPRNFFPDQKWNPIDKFGCKKMLEMK